MQLKYSVLQYDIEPGLSELFENVSRVRFLRHSIVPVSSTVVSTIRPAIEMA